MKRITSTLCSLLASALLSSAAMEWPAWRGPDGTGIGSAENLPVEWTTESNVAWKLELPAWSGSSPIISGDSLYLISPSKEAPKVKPKEEPPQDGRRWRPPSPPGNILGPGGQEILLYSISRKDGSVQWKAQLDSGNAINFKQNSSSPSPVTDGDTIFTVTGNGTVTAVSNQGKKLWSYAIQDHHYKFGIQAGYASSPILFEDFLIIQVLHGMHTDDPSYLLALDKNTGKQRWYHERETDAIKESPDSYATPNAVQNAQWNAAHHSGR